MPSALAALAALAAPAEITAKRDVPPLVQAEMATMGPEVSGSLAAARALALAKCGHEDAPQPASGCLRSLVGSDNREHYWIATQDRDLRRALSEIPGTPSLFLTAHGLTIEAPSEVDKASDSQAVAETYRAVGGACRGL